MVARFLWLRYKRGLQALAQALTGWSIKPTQFYFLFPVPIERSSKLRRASSRPPLVAAVVRLKVVVLDSNPGWSLWVVDRRPLLETNRLDLFSLGSPEELGRLLETTGLFEALPFRDELRALSESGFYRKGERALNLHKRENLTPWLAIKYIFWGQNSTKNTQTNTNGTLSKDWPLPWMMARHLKICVWSVHCVNHAPNRSVSQKLQLRLRICLESPVPLIKEDTAVQQKL